MTDALLRRSQACQRWATVPPLAAWPSDGDIDGRIEAGDPVAYFDALVDAIDQLEAVRDAIDALLVEPAGPFRHGKGTVGRLKELAARAAAGVSLFAHGSGRDGHRPSKKLPVNHGR